MVRAKRTQDLVEGQLKMQGQADNLAVGMEKLHARTSEMEAPFEALKLKVGSGDVQPDDYAAMAADKKRKVSEAASAWLRSGREGSLARARALASSGAGATRSAGTARSTGSTPRGGRRDAGPRGDLRCRFVLQRLPQVMKGRLPALMKGLHGFSGKDLLRAQCPRSSTAFASVVMAGSDAAEVLQRRKKALVTGCFEGSTAVPLVIALDREKWLHKLLMLEWPILEQMRPKHGLEDAILSKSRVGDKSCFKLHVRRSAQGARRRRVPLDHRWWP